MAMSGHTSKLVHTGYCNGNTSLPIKVYVAYKISQDTAGNKSTVQCGMYVTIPSGWDIGPWDDFNGSYVGTTGNTFNGTIPNCSGTRWLAENKSFTVNHNDNGTGKATIYWKWGVNSPWGRVQNISGSFTIDLPTIARKSTVALSASSVQMGKSLTINITRQASSFTHTLRYKFGSASGTIATGVGTSKAWTVPASLISQIPNALRGTGTIYCDTYSGSTKIGTTSVSFTATVPNATTPTVSPTSVAVGKAIAISMPRAVSAYTHKLTYSFAGATGDIGSNLGTSKTWTVPTSLASKIPNASSGTMTITCETYNGTAKVGTKSVTVKVTVPEAAPSVNLALSLVSDLGDAFSGLYVQVKTKVKGEITATAQYGAGLRGFSMKVNGKTYSGEACTSDFLSKAGSIAVTAYATDTRGNTGSATKNITVIPYSDPKILPASGESEVVAARCDGSGNLTDSGTNLLIKAKKGYSPVMSGSTQKNFCEIRYRYKLESADSYSDWTTILSKNSGHTDEIGVIVPGSKLGGLDIKSSYLVQVQAIDDIGGYSTTTISVPTDKVYMHRDGARNSMGLGKYAEGENLLDVAWDAHFRGEVRIGDTGMSLKEYILSVINGGG